MRLFRQVLACLLWVLMPPAHADVPSLALCAQASMVLGPVMRMVEDPAGELGPQQVASLDSTRFVTLAEGLPRSFTRSAIWLAIEVHNADASACRQWLSLGNPRIKDIQVHLRRDGRWGSQRAGAAYPLSEWATLDRQPVFAIELAPGEQALLLARVQSDQPLLINPLFRSTRALSRDRQHEHLLDGVALGVSLLAVLIGLAMGWMLRSALLLTLTVAVGNYVLITALANNYLIYWPQAWGSERGINALLSAVAVPCMFGSICLLFGLHRLSPVWRWSLAAMAGLYVLLRLYGVVGDAIIDNEFRRWPLVAGAGILLAGFAMVLLRGQRHSVMSWMMLACLMVQLVSRYVLQMERSLPWETSPVLATFLTGLVWQSSYGAYNLSASLTGIVFLAFILVQEVVIGRRREHRAQLELVTQRATENERLEHTVAERTAQLRAALQSRGNLLARISHDLRSPLASIIDYARMLQGQAGASSDFTRKIERNARQQLELIDELLEFSRDGTEPAEVVPTPGYFHAFLHEMSEEGRLFALRQDNRFSARWATDLPVAVRADFRRLRQVLFNLFSNAAKFTSGGDISFEVERLPDEKAGVARLAFSVADTGIGIALAERDTIMLPYRRGSNASGIAGTGLGLPIVRQLLEAMGSSLELDGQARRGSRLRFVLSLPLAQEDELEGVFTESHESALDGMGRRILVVDDVELNREWLADLLAGYHFDVTVAADGQAAWEALQRERFDLLLCDQAMPGWDGWALLARVRTLCPYLPSVLYSAAPPRRPQGFDGELDFDAVLLKPAASDSLLACIDRLARR